MQTDRELLELAARAASMVDYDPETGLMIWKNKPDFMRDAKRWNARYGGKECGTIDDKGYRRILFRFEKGSVFRIRTHRLAWFISNGVLPSGEIDHINQDKLDNRILNLRDVPKEINQRNGTRKRNNTSGVTGVTWHKQRNKWCAQCNMFGIHYHIGTFDKIEDAEKAVREFRSKHGFTETHGNIVQDKAARRAIALPAAEMQLLKESK